MKFKIQHKPSWEQEHVNDILLKEKKKHILVLHNDDINTFDFVISALIKICKHTPEQAEQCTWLVHYKGKCDVKSGSYEFLEPMCTALLDRGLSAEII